MSLRLAELPEPNRGIPWRQLEPGWTYRTSARTITETDLVQFAGAAGFFEPLFLDARHGKPDGTPGRVVPAMLTLSYAEGLVLQTRVLLGTGLAFLKLETMEVRAPVCVGDTIVVRVEVSNVKPTSDGVRALVTTRNAVIDQDERVVLEYSPVRLQR